MDPEEMLSVPAECEAFDADVAAEEALQAQVQDEVESLEVGDVPQTDDERQLTRYVRWLRREELERDRLQDQMRAMVQEKIRRIETAKHLFEHTAARIAERLLAGKRQKSIKTPYGTAGFRLTPGRTQVADFSLLLDAVNDSKLPVDLIRTKYSPDLAAIKAWMERTGEIPEGCEIIGPENKFYVK